MNEQRTPQDQTQVETRADQPRVEQGTIAQEDTTFLPGQRMDAMRERWNDVQAGFVDNPRDAVQQAHALVTEVVDDLVRTFTNERTALENQWNSGGEADTEALRVALRRYRSFFNRLLGTSSQP
jgi:hypothetical protein